MRAVAISKQAQGRRPRAGCVRAQSLSLSPVLRVPAFLKYGGVGGEGAGSTRNAELRTQSSRLAAIGNPATHHVESLAIAVPRLASPWSGRGSGDPPARTKRHGVAFPHEPPGATSRDAARIHRQVAAGQSQRAQCLPAAFGIRAELGLEPRQTPPPPTPTRRYTFERGVKKTAGGQGWADVRMRSLRSGKYKGKRKDPAGRLPTNCSCTARTWTTRRSWWSATWAASRFTPTSPARPSASTASTWRAVNSHTRVEIGSHVTKSAGQRLLDQRKFTVGTPSAASEARIGMSSPPAVHVTQRNLPEEIAIAARMSSGNTSQKSHRSTTCQPGGMSGISQEGVAVGGYPHRHNLRNGLRRCDLPRCRPKRHANDHLPFAYVILPCFLSCCWAVLTACFHFLPNRFPSITRSTELSQRSGWIAAIIGWTSTVLSGTW